MSEANEVCVVALTYEKGRVEHWLRFGEPARKVRVAKGHVNAYFAAGAPFAYVRWRAGAYGTGDWQVFVCLAPRGGAAGLLDVPGIDPGAEVLLHAGTPHYARKVLALMQQIEGMRVRLADVPPAYWREVQAALRCRKAPPPFALAEGKAS